MNTSLLTIEESVNYFYRRLTELDEDIPDQRTLLEIIDLVLVDVSAVVCNMEADEVRESLANPQESCIGKIYVEDPFEEFHFNLVNEITDGLIQTLKVEELPPILEIKTQNLKYVKITT